MNDNEDRFKITDKGTAFVTYIGAQEQAADSGMAEDFGEALDTFEREVYAPIKKHVATEMVKKMVEGTMGEVCEFPEFPSLEELDKVAYSIGAAFLDTYAIIADQEGGDA